MENIGKHHPPSSTHIQPIQSLHMHLFWFSCQRSAPSVTLSFLFALRWWHSGCHKLLKIGSQPPNSHWPCWPKFETENDASWKSQHHQTPRCWGGYFPGAHGARNLRFSWRKKHHVSDENCIDPKPTFRYKREVKRRMWEGQRRRGSTDLPVSSFGPGTMSGVNGMPLKQLQLLHVDPQVQLVGLENSPQVQTERHQELPCPCL